MKYNDKLPKELEDMFKEPSQNKISKMKGKTITLKQSENTGFISPILLGSLICILSFIGMIVAHLFYLITG